MYVWKGCAHVQKQKCKFGALQHLKLYKKHQVPLKHNLHFAKPLQRAAHPMECCPVYFLNHANTGQPHSCAPKLGGFRLPCGIPVSMEVEGNSEERRREAWPMNGKHLSHCGPLTPPCYAFPSFRSHDSGRLPCQKCWYIQDVRWLNTKPVLSHKFAIVLRVSWCLQWFYFIFMNITSPWAYSPWAYFSILEKTSARVL